MRYVNYRICLDIQSGGSGVILTAKRGDTGRRLWVTLTDGGQPYLPGSDCFPVFTARKPDGHVVFNECTLEAGRVCYSLREQLLAVPGTVECELRLYGSDGLLLTSAAFDLAVEDTVFHEEDIPESQDDYSALNYLVGQNQLLREELLRLKAQLETLRRQLEGGASGEGGSLPGTPAVLSQVTLRAAAWEGSRSPYSQLVNIGGVTVCSQVDLKPDPAQMELFRGMDLALVTENDGGAVRVYAIGQKPQEDHTLQVSITEVSL